MVGTIFGPNLSSCWWLVIRLSFAMTLDSWGHASWCWKSWCVCKSRSWIRSIYFASAYELSWPPNLLPMSQRLNRYLNLKLELLVTIFWSESISLLALHYMFSHCNDIVNIVNFMWYRYSKREKLGPNNVHCLFRSPFWSRPEILDHLYHTG